MQFMITAYDGTDVLAPERRKNARPEHLENIKKVREKGSVVCAGGLTNEEGLPIGSFLILEFATRALFDEYLSTEPYVIQKVWEKITVEQANVVILKDEMVGK